MSARYELQKMKGARLGLPLKLLLRAARHLRHGSLEIHIPGHPPQLFSGTEDGPHGVLQIQDPSFLKRLLKRGDMGFAEGYMAGEWNTPDLATLLKCLDRNLDGFGVLERGRIMLRWLKVLKQRVLLRNNRSGSRRNIAYHYDLGNDFYRLWLDPSMTYSAANFTDARQDLNAAQARKYERLLDLCGATESDHILEIGCGWGGFALHAARERGCRVTGLTLSREQQAWAREKVREAGLEHRIEIRLQDYRDVSETFDHIVSIEMFEAVGEAYWPVYFQTVHDRLKPGGRAALQVITIDDSEFERYRRDVDFIRQYIFPGGILPSVSVFEQQCRQAGLSLSHREFHGSDYAHTLACWAQRFKQAESSVKAQGFDERFIRMWHYYLAYCEAGFRNGRIDLMQTVLQSRLR
ncbi:cyclopropane-fatty-acyl-phospholipid synthase [Natronospira proteinivora]|uniref:Cyclopropane-fatty-acyl-phospholipid synthase n=1 Tax=Natronospira proteinivora TaxID=1807133 RepID=A0ABT1G9J9_9GAMM|nr:cyclopropane-fatty-acyl-phospholipid synthase family protein [Natronospira proteinivora]MCP1727993.1 cyclopropane-fatty-acyl-phospholipid synthase [Natronospira proteinivora]